MLSRDPLHSFKSRRVRWRSNNKRSINRLLKADSERKKRNHFRILFLPPRKDHSRIAAFTSSSVPTHLFNEATIFEIEPRPEAIYLAPRKLKRNLLEHPLKTRQETNRNDLYCLFFCLLITQIVYK